MNILVCGDSFATLDPEQSHWADIWASDKEYSVLHKGYPGESHVNIVTKILNTTNIEEFNLIIYHITDYLRTQIDIANEGYKNVLDNVLGLYSDKNFTKAEKLNILDNVKITEDFVYEPENISPNNLDPAFEQEIICKDKTFNLYNSINLYWLLQANYNSFLLLKERCKAFNIPLVIALEPELSIYADESFYPKDTNIFKTNKDEIGWFSNSTNHLGREMHTTLSKEFEDFIVNNNILK